MKTRILLLAAAACGLAAFAVQPAAATGRMRCNAGPQSGWQTQAQLIERLTRLGWRVRRAKVDGGCYEVYGTTPQGERVEAYFHPVTLQQLLVSRRGQIIFRAPGH